MQRQLAVGYRMLCLLDRFADQACGVLIGEAIQDLGSDLARGHHARHAQASQVLGNPRRALLDELCERIDRKLSGTAQMQHNPDPRGIGKQSEDFRGSTKSEEGSGA